MRKQALISSMVQFEASKKERSVLRIFAVFFHPTRSVTAIGGAEKRFAETLKLLCRKKDVEITVLESAPSLLQEADIDCNTHLLPSSLSGRGWLTTYMGWLAWLVNATIKSLSLIREEKPKIIFVPNNTAPNLILGVAVSAFTRRPLCVVTHHIDTPFLKPEDHKNDSLYNCYRSLEYSIPVALAKTLASYTTIYLLKKARGIIAVSNFTATVLRNSGIPETRISVSGNAVDLDLARIVEYSHAEKVYDGIFVGRIAKEKGVFDLLRVWKEVVKVKRDAKLLLVGSGLELNQIRQRIATLNLENRVFLRGSCSDEELYRLLDSSRVFIFPSLFEGWGIAVAEALACGLPVVAYDIPALREVFGDCKSVFLVPVRDSENMTATVLDVLGANEMESRELGLFATSYCGRFRWEEIAEKDFRCLQTIGEKD